MIVLLLICFFSFCEHAFAQNAFFQYDNAYLIPRHIFVGDSATLVLPLPAVSENMPDIVLTSDVPYFPYDADIDFHKIILERRRSESRLLIEFTAFAPGVLEFPVIEIAGIYFSGIVVTVNSIIDNRSSPVLSGPAGSLAMPGTAFLLYAVMAGIVFFILFSIWFLLKGKQLAQKMSEKWKRWKHFVSIKFTEKRLSRAVLRGVNKRLILDKLSEEFRVFLSFLTGVNCRAMTAREFGKLSLDVFATQNLNASFLLNFFRRCDELRFSGHDIKQQEILRLLAYLRSILSALEKTNREKIKAKRVTE